MVAQKGLRCFEVQLFQIAVFGTKEKVGGAAGLSVGTASACIVDAGDAEDLVNEIVEKVAELKE